MASFCCSTPVILSTSIHFFLSIFYPEIFFTRFYEKLLLFKKYLNTTLLEMFGNLQKISFMYYYN